MPVGPQKRQFQTENLFPVTENYIVLWAGKICWAIYFQFYSPNLRLRKDNFSQQHLKKICRTLHMIMILGTLV